MLPDVARVEEFWIPLVDEPIGTFVARDPGGAPRDRRARRLAAPAARVPHVRLHPRRDAARPAARRERRRAGRRHGELGRAARRPGAPRAGRRGDARGRRGDRRRPGLRGTSRSGRTTRSASASASSRSATWRGRLENFVTPPPSLLIMQWTVGKRLTILAALAGSPRPARRGGAQAAPARPRGRRRARSRSASSSRARRAPGRLDLAPPVPRSLRQRLRLSGRRLGGDRGLDRASAASDCGPRATATATGQAQSLALRRRDHRHASRAKRAARPSAAPRPATSPARPHEPDGSRPGDPVGRTGASRSPTGATSSRSSRAPTRARGRRRAGLPRLRHRARRPSDRAARQAPGRLGDPGRLRGGERAGGRRRRSRSRPARRRRSRAAKQKRRRARRSREAGAAAAATLARARRPAAEADRGRLRLPGLRPVVVRRHVRRLPRRRPRNWHHGDDIFAPLGAPILACADGIVFSVGWNDIGGNRLWLRDSQGNEFYYAHLSAFSPLAKNGALVKAGEVLGFVGNTGDAAGTPTHLHFEVHPPR